MEARLPLLHHQLPMQYLSLLLVPWVPYRLSNPWNASVRCSGLFYFCNKTPYASPDAMHQPWCEDCGVNGSHRRCMRHLSTKLHALYSVARSPPVQAAVDCMNVAGNTSLLLPAPRLAIGGFCFLGDLVTPHLCPTPRVLTSWQCRLFRTRRQLRIAHNESERRVPMLRCTWSCQR